MFDLGALIVRILAAGPLLYIGLVLVLDPDSFVGFTEDFANALRTFEKRLRGWQSAERLYRPGWIDVSAKMRFSLQGLGAVLSAVALLALLGA